MSLAHRMSETNKIACQCSDVPQVPKDSTKHDKNLPCADSQCLVGAKKSLTLSLTDLFHSLTRSLARRSCHTLILLNGSPVSLKHNKPQTSSNITHHFLHRPRFTSCSLQRGHNPTKSRSVSVRPDTSGRFCASCCCFWVSEPDLV